MDFESTTTSLILYPESAWKLYTTNSPRGYWFSPAGSIVPPTPAVEEMVNVSPAADTHGTPMLIRIRQARISAAAGRVGIIYGREVQGSGVVIGYDDQEPRPGGAFGQLNEVPVVELFRFSCDERGAVEE